MPVSKNARPVFQLKVLVAYLMISFTANVYALPAGGTVASGSASISGGANSTTITQLTQNTILNWQSFNIGQNELVHFLQPNSSSIALNRVTGPDPSSILGSLSANGKVFLVNPNGILFGKNAQVNVGGLIAATLNITDADFMSSHYRFSGTSNGTVLNQGSLKTNADTGYIALLGANVGNDGVITARLGTAALAAGTAVTLDVAGDGLLNVTVNQGAVHALVQNSGLIQADGGLVLLTAQSAGNLLLTAVNNTGVIQAQTIDNHNGAIKLLADMQSGTVNVTGTLDASGTGTGQTGGSVTATGQHVGLFGGHINASGDAGGGTVLIGGDLHGANPSVQNSTAAYVSADSTINADAVTKGNGGKVIVWANDINRYYGNISARGGVQGGDGGFTEVSGKNNLVFGGYVDLRAPSGRTGTLLLDPYNLTIQAAGPNLNGTPGTDLNVAVNTPNIFSLTDYLGINSIITTGQVVTQLNTANVTLQATNDITVAAAIDASGNTVGHALTLQAGHDVIINGALTAASVGGGSVNLLAGNNVTVVPAITALGGSVTLSAGNNGTGSGTVTFSAVTADNLTIRFNPVSYTTTSAEISVYAPKATLSDTAIFDARAWTFVNNASATAQIKPYNGTTVATLNNPFTFLNGPDGSTAGQLVFLNAGAANFNSAHVSSANTVSFTGYGLNGADGLHYALFAQPVSQSKTITAAPLTASASITGVSKTYDGLLAATGSTVSGSTSGELSGDSFTLGTSGLSLSFSNAHVVGAKTIGATGNVVLGTLTSSGSGDLSGSSSGNRVVSDASDYALAGQPVIASVAGTINAASLTAAASITGAAKTYDGLLAATGSTVSGSTSGELSGDSFTLGTSGLSLNFSNAHVVGAKTIGATGSVTLGTLTSTGSGNHSGTAGNLVVSAASDYTLAGQPVIASVAGTINAASLTAAAIITGAAKTYDGLLAAIGSTVSGSTSGEIGTDTVLLDISALNLNFSNAHVAPAKTIGATGSVTLGTLTSTGSGNHSGTAGNLVVSAASDYALAGQPVIASVAGTINAASLTAAASITGAAKTYDGLLAATGSTVSGSTSGELSGDSFTLGTSGLSLNFSNAHVVGAKTIGATGNVVLGTLTSSGSGDLSGSSSGNRVASAASDYALAAQPVIGSVAGTINAASLTFSATRAYDATLNFAANTIGTMGMITTGVGLENLVVTGVGSVPLKGVAAGTQTLNTAGLALTNGTGLASDYTFSGGTHTATVTPKALTISGITAGNKVYDGFNNATIITSGASYNGLVSGDALTVNATGTFANKNIGTGKTVILASLYSGADVGNYNIAGQANTTASIFAAPQTIPTPSPNTPIAPLTVKPFMPLATVLIAQTIPTITNATVIDYELNWIPLPSMIDILTEQNYELQNSKKFMVSRFQIWRGAYLTKADTKPESFPVIKSSPVAKVLVALVTQESPPVEEEPPPVKLKIVGNPLDGGKFAKIKIGMTIKQVEELIGAPDWTWQQFTGATSTPYYTGKDRKLVQYAYKSEGMLTFSSGQERLIRMLVNRAG